MRAALPLSLACLVSGCTPMVQPVPADWPNGEDASDQAYLMANTHLVVPPLIGRTSAEPYREILTQFDAALRFCEIEATSDDAIQTFGEAMQWVPTRNYTRYRSETFSFRCPDSGEVIQ